MNSAIVSCRDRRKLEVSKISGGRHLELKHGINFDLEKNNTELDLELVYGYDLE